METIEIYTRGATILHLIGVILGVGSATITDVLFFKFVGDKHITAQEAKLMDKLAKLIWVSLIILIISGLMLFIPNFERLSVSGKFLTKNIGLFVLVINGLVLGYYIRPKLVKIDFSNNGKSRFGLSHEVNRKMRRLATIAGVVSITTWYFIFILGALRGITFPAVYGISAYIFILIVSCIGGLMHENGVFKKIQRKLKENI